MPEASSVSLLVIVDIGSLPDPPGSVIILSKESVSGSEIIHFGSGSSPCSHQEISFFHAL